MASGYQTAGARLEDICVIAENSTGQIWFIYYTFYTTYIPFGLYIKRLVRSLLVNEILKIYK